MKAETIKKIDIWIGKPVCFLITLSRSFKRLFHPHRPLPPVRRILFIKLIEQGATVLACDAIRRAVAMVGRENIFFLVFKENREILDIMDMIPEKNILTLRNEGFLTFSYDVMRQLLAIRRLSINATVDMEFFARASAIIASLSGAELRVGLHRYSSEIPYRGDLMTHRIQYNPHLHTSVAYSLMVQALALQPDEVPLPKRPVPPRPGAPPAFQVSPEERAAFIQKVAPAGFDADAGGPVVLVNPNASDMLPLRKWPLEYFLSLGEAILRDYPKARLVVTGAPTEGSAAEKLCALWKSPRAVNLAGKTSLRELIILYTLADVLVTNDSGPAHFAGLTGIHTIVLFGPETPKLFGPLGTHAYALEARFACSPCVNAFNHRFSPCTDNLCMKSISWEEVYEKVKECLASPPS